MFEQEPICEVKCIHAEKVAEVKEKLLDIEKHQLLADIFKALGDPTRLRIIEALRFGELCVCDIAAILAISESAVSHQLRVLRNLRLVRYRKCGKIIYYSLDDEHIQTLFREGLEHVQHG